MSTDAIVAPFPFRMSGSISGYRQDWWHVSPDVDLPGVRPRGGILCRTGRVGWWSGPEYPPSYYVTGMDVARVCPVCRERLARMIARWPALYEQLRARLERTAVNGRVPRATVPELPYTLHLNEALLPALPPPPYLTVAERVKRARDIEAP